MLPLNILLKMPNFNIKMENNSAVKVILVEHETQMETAILELRRLLGKLPVVGFDLKSKDEGYGYSISTAYEVLVLHVEGCCLLINLTHMTIFPATLSKFLLDNAICFVGLNLSNNSIKWRSNMKPFFVRGHDFEKVVTTGVNIQHLAAKILKDSSLRGCCLKTLATKTGFDYKEVKLEGLKEFILVDFCFSEEDVKCVINQAHMCYKLGAFFMKKLEYSDAAITIAVIFALLVFYIMINIVKKHYT